MQLRLTPPAYGDLSTFVATTRSLLHREDGQALVEFALVLPVLLLILLGIVDFGKTMNYWNDSTHLTAEAARYAAVNRKPDPASALSLQQQILNQTDTAELRTGGTDSVGTAAQVCVEFPNGTPVKIGDPVRVRMSFTYSWIPFLADAGGLASATVASSTVMRLEAVPTTFFAGCT